MRVLNNTDTNLVKEILGTSDNFYEWEHLPPNDVYDFQSHSQYYYHAHAKSDSGDGAHDDEHGHFHTFIRGKAFPDGITPAPLKDFDPNTEISDINTHIIGIGMNEMGHPMRLFTTNRWVTADTWCAAEDILTMLDNYNIDHTAPSWPVNLWITNMIRLFKPQIKTLIQERDNTVKSWTQKHPDRNTYEDRDLEVTSLLNINLLNHIDAIEKALNI